MNDVSWLVSLPHADASAFDVKRIALFSLEFIVFSQSPVTYEDGQMRFMHQSYKVIGYDKLRKEVVTELPVDLPYQPVVPDGITVIVVTGDS